MQPLLFLSLTLFSFFRGSNLSKTTGQTGKFGISGNAFTASMTKNQNTRFRISTATVAPISETTSPGMTTNDDRENSTMTWTTVGSKLMDNYRPIYKIEKEIIDRIFAHYEKSVRPYPWDGVSDRGSDGPTMVDVNVFVRNIPAVNEIAMEVSLDLLIRMYWNDPRLRYAVPPFANITYLKASEAYAKRLWVPDIFFPNERRGSESHGTVPTHMVRIHPNGNVLYTERYMISFGCYMNLVKYPFDLQNCIIQMGSFGNTVESLIFSWVKSSPIVVNKELLLSKFELTNAYAVPCDNVHKTGNFSCLRLGLLFRRQLGYHLVESYLPTTLLVFASWMSFWIDAGSVPGRVSLAVTTMLTTVASSSSIKSSLPPVSYVKAIDIWIGICIFSVFMALAEFALVNYLLRQERKTVKEPVTAEDCEPLIQNNSVKRTPERKFPNHAPPQQQYCGEHNNTAEFVNLNHHESEVLINRGRQHQRWGFEQKVASFSPGVACRCVATPSPPLIRRNYLFENFNQSANVAGTTKFSNRKCSNFGRAARIDRISRILFPTVFFTLTTIYVIVICVI